ncbi:conserved hypothetical protein [Ixodes scapularis]|uniref:Uncharacterized protein n=1 Tax=Ixodes scapularis TaxID=6945 RepID=B7QNT7_IXOSC|nr:conserved hypothetical protein [Ixodes scapularis]|eukprot:XP_002416592.1 conserved hypothetical protein [Ixodes scapularis]
MAWTPPKSPSPLPDSESPRTGTSPSRSPSRSPLPRIRSPRSRKALPMPPRLPRGPRTDPGTRGSRPPPEAPPRGSPPPKWTTRLLKTTGTALKRVGRGPHQRRAPSAGRGGRDPPGACPCADPLEASPCTDPPGGSHRGWIQDPVDRCAEVPLPGGPLRWSGT